MSVGCDPKELHVFWPKVLLSYEFQFKNGKMEEGKLCEQIACEIKNNWIFK